MNATSAIIPRLLDRPHEKTEVVESGSIGQLSLSGSPGESGRRSTAAADEGLHTGPI